MLLATPFASWLTEPIDVAAVEEALRRSGSSGSEFYKLDTPAGPRFYPRVTTILDGIAQPWLARWIARLEQDAFRAAAVETLARLAPDGQPIPRTAALDAMTRLRPELESERVKSQAATFGSRLHSAIEHFLSGTVRPIHPDVVPAFEKWREWWAASGYRVERIEQRVGCAACGYGGTADAILIDPAGLRWVADWKSSKRIADNYALQLSAYGHALDVTDPGAPPLAGGLVVRIPKTARGRMEVRSFPAAQMAENFTAFKAAVLLWRWTREAAGADAGDPPLNNHAPLSL